MLRLRKNISTNFIVLSLLAFAILLLSIAYATINSITLDVTGTAVAKAQNGIFITDSATVKDEASEGSSVEVIKYIGTVLQSQTTLSATDGDAYVTQSVTIYNASDRTYKFVDVLTDEDGEYYDNTGIEYEISNFNIGDLIEPGETKQIYIKFKYADSTVASSNILKSYINFKMEELSGYVTRDLAVRLEGIDNAGGTHSLTTETWTDLSKNGNDGTIVNGTWQDDCLVLDGSSTVVKLPEMNSRYQTIQTTFSVTEGTGIVMGNWENGGGGITVNGDGYITGEYYINGAYKSIVSTVSAITNQIYNVALTYDGNEVVLYIDGVEEGSVTATSEGIGAPQNTTIMVIGANPSGSNSFSGLFKEKIYTASVYVSALTQEEIQRNAKADIAMAKGVVNKLGDNKINVIAETSTESTTTCKITATVSDVGSSGLSAVYCSTSSARPSANSTEWENNTDTTFELTGKEEDTTYYIWLKDGDGNISTSSVSVTTPSINYWSYTADAYSSGGDAKMGYATIYDALSRSEEGEAIKEINDCSDASKAKISKNITIDINGKNLTKYISGYFIDSGITNFQLKGSGNIAFDDVVDGFTIEGYMETSFSGTMRGQTIFYNKPTGTLKTESGPARYIGASYSIISFNVLKLTGGFYIHSGNNNGAAILVESGSAYIVSTNIQSTYADALVARTKYSSNTDAKASVSVYNTTITCPGNVWVSSHADMELGNCTINAKSLINQDSEDTKSSIVCARCTENIQYVDGRNVYIMKSDYSTYYDIWSFNNSTTNVRFPSWTVANSQDDIEWPTGTAVTLYNRTAYYVRILKSKHNNETGPYTTHIYDGDTCMHGITGIYLD